jgi:hypothetical protein
MVQAECLRHRAQLRARALRSSRNRETTSGVGLGEHRRSPMISAALQHAA